MDALTARAVDDYHALLRDETRAAPRSWRSASSTACAPRKLTFGGRVLCPFPRPNLVSPADYEQIRGVCRRIFSAIEKVEARLGRELWDRVDLTPEERELVGIDPGYRRSSPSSRLDSFLTTSSYQFVELNAETPGRHRLQRGARPTSSSSCPSSRGSRSATRCAASARASGCSRRSSPAIARPAAARSGRPSRSSTTKTCPRAPSTTCSASSSRRAATRRSSATRAT